MEGEMVHDLKMRVVWVVEVVQVEVVVVEVCKGFVGHKLTARDPVVADEGECTWPSPPVHFLPFLFIVL